MLHTIYNKKASVHLRYITIIITLVIITLGLSIYSLLYYQKAKTLKTRVESLTSEKASKEHSLALMEKELKELKSEDQYVINKKLEEEIGNIQTTYKKSLESFESLLSLKELSKKTEEFDKAFAKALNMLSQRNYSSASSTLTNLNNQIAQEKQKIAGTFTIPENVPSSNTPPSSGYSRQTVNTDIGSFLVSIISTDLNSTRVIVDTASNSDCSDNCPVLPLSDYVARNGAFAGINGSYFCPSDYPSCAGKTNSFDTLLMNKNKVYFNSDNNKYSTVPLIYFSGNSAGIRGQSLEWGRDTGVDAVLANQGLLLSGGNIIFGGDGDPKKGSKGGRSFVGNKGNTAYIGVVHNATVAEAAHALKALGLENALNLDDGGSTALWFSGYKVGPGRNLPNVVLFIRK